MLTGETANIFVDGAATSPLETGLTALDSSAPEIDPAPWKLKIGDDDNGKEWGGAVQALAFYCSSLGRNAIEGLASQGLVAPPRFY